MKKSIFVLIFIAVTGIFTGCGTNPRASATSLGTLSDLDGGGIVMAAALTEPYDPNVLGSYATEFNVKSKSRAHNIKLSSDAINNQLLLPGEIFSFNEAVGPTNKAHGYKIARIFVKGQDSKGYGGGVCQVSSTLYNAVLEAGLPVAERHEHSKEVHYVPEGYDAATSYGSSDFQFINDRAYPVVIRSSTDNGNLVVSVEAAS